MRHFNYFPNGGPFPGTCAMCGNPRDLWALGFEHPRGGDAMACSTCVGEIAENIGWAPKQPLIEAIERKNAEIDELAELLDRVPNYTEGFINGVRNSLADFVFAVSDSGNRNGNAPVQDAGASQPADVESDKPADFSPEAHGESSEYKRPASVSADSSRNKPGRPRKI